MKTYLTTMLSGIMLLFSSLSKALPVLSSLPGAPATIFLDFNGHTVQSAVWNNGMPIHCAPASLSDAQITEIFNRVAEDYRPFSVNITTDSARFLQAPVLQRIRIIVTPTSAWKPGVGGIAFIGSFTWGDDTPAFVFTDRLSNSPKYIAECTTHESGHTLGLSHQSTYDGGCNLVETYNTGSGSGEIGWAPVMGNSYYKNMTGWNDGPTPYGCASVQDNLSTLTSLNGFSYRTDDYQDLSDSTAYTLDPTSFSLDGIITTSTDRDAFRYQTNGQHNLHLEARPFSVSPQTNIGANLDIKLSLYAADGSLIRVYDPATSMSVTVDTILTAGTYYFILDGSGNQNASQYGSLGSYTLTGFRGALAIQEVSLQGSIDEKMHRLQWTVRADEPITEQVLEVSENGRQFTQLANATSSDRTYTYHAPENRNMLYYRVRVRSILGQEAVSNIISLSSKNNTTRWTIQTLVQTEMHIRAQNISRFRLVDMNGRVLQQGISPAGSSRIPLQSYAPGMYIVQVQDAEGIHSERLIKQ